ncbi:hypothetical protein ACM66B_005046 [Microbotryomycetes sp. NB124-2]
MHLSRRKPSVASSGSPVTTSAYSAPQAAATAHHSAGGGGGVEPLAKMNPSSSANKGGVVVIGESSSPTSHVFHRRLLTARRSSIAKYAELKDRFATHPTAKLANRHKELAAVVVFAAVMVLLWLMSSLKRIASGAPAPCDAHASNGRLLVNLTSPLHTHWRPFDESTCPPLPAYLPALWELTHGSDRPLPTYPASTFSDDYRLVASDPIPPKWLQAYNMTDRSAKGLPDPIWFLRKRRRSTPPTILVLGDSVDRNGLVHFCQLFKRNVTISHYHDIHKRPPDPPQGDLTRGHGPKFDGWDQRGLPHMCEIPFYSSGSRSTNGVAVRVVNGFHYGMDALDEFNTPDHNDWHAPGRIEQRIEQLVVPFLEQLGGTDKVDVVQLHSGMWDLALFGMQDDKTKWSLTVPLTPEQLAWWQERMRRTIYLVRQTFPKSRVVFRKLHRTDDAVAGTQYITNLQVFFSSNMAESKGNRADVKLDRRVHQLRHLQEEVARSEGLPVFDFGHLLEGYQAFQEKVHPLLIPGGCMYAQNLLYQLDLALRAPYRQRSGWSLW